MTTINQADKVYYGGNLASAVYAGVNKVWPSFKPSDISGLKVHLDASKLALANGAAVTSWPNLAGAPNPTIIGAPSPTFRTNALNTIMPVVKITGAQGRFRFAGTGVDKDYTIVFVARRHSLRAGRIICASIIAANTPNILYGFWSTRHDCAFAEGWLDPDIAVDATLAWKLYSADSTSVAVARLFDNGTLLRSGAATPAKGLNGSLNIVGHDDVSTEDADAEIAEVIMYNRKLSDAERQQVEGYLRLKWAAPTIFVPTDLSTNLIGWFDATDAATITIAGSGVSAWANKGVGGMTLTQTTDANRPTYDSVNKVVNFAQTQVLNGAGGPNPYDVAFVGKPLAAGDWRTLLRSAAAGHEVMIDSTTTKFGMYNAGFWQSGALTWDTSWGIAYARIKSGAIAEMARDGGAITTTSPNLIGATSVAPTMFGAYAGPPPSQAWGGLKEMIFIPNGSGGVGTGAGTRAVMEGYLAHRHGLTALLPAGHRFKTAPP